MPLKIGADLPPLEDATEWINGELGSGDLIGAPSLVYFWAVSCHICKDNLPKLAQWREKYGDDLQMVGIHMPRQEEDMDVEAVRKAIANFSIPDPIGIDNTHEVGDVFENKFWPAYFLFDADGKLRARTAGDVGLEMLEKSLEKVMSEAAQSSQ
ncbi:MAG: TlpA family protein disulfide reductase [Armatimonadetes bacterium]|nr:TlpA family protein disulfide reductase [Armatimonadota bacterium]